jgi:hypothetical protein
MFLEAYYLLFGLSGMHLFRSGRFVARGDDLAEMFAS